LLGKKRRISISKSLQKMELDGKGYATKTERRMELSNA
jgi:hypothetical protein